MEIQNNRFRKIRKWGNSMVVVLSSVDIKDLNIKEGDWMDISDALVLSDELYTMKNEKD